VDDRLGGALIADELSIGDYVLTGGEIAAMAVIDAVTRLIPGVLGGADSAAADSFSDGLLEHAHYTRPPVFEGAAVPAVLLSGHHREIERWRLESSLLRTFVNRPDLLRQRVLTAEETEILRRWQADLGALLAGRRKAPQK
jgi:tRNA (guanine37-N1)-methyltransferase